MSSILQVKVILLGDTNVGKTSLLNRLTGGLPNETPPSPTLGIDIHSVFTTVGKTSVQLSFWDVAGQNNFRQSLPRIYKDAHIALLVYDVSCAESFNNLHNWLINLNRYGPSDCKLFIFGNKTDLPKRINAKKDRLTFFSENNMVHPDIFEVSAVEMTAPLGYVKVIASAGKVVAEARKRNERSLETETESGAVSVQQQKKRYCCCFGWLTKRR